MTLLTDLRAAVSAILKSAWTTREGETVPETDDLALGNDSVSLDATVLYADLVDSTDLVKRYQAHFAAEVYKAFLGTASRIIRARNGSITAFDGDRIMGVFLGSSKNTQAAQAALQINWAVGHIINPAIKNQYPNTSYQVKHVVGVDTGPLCVARTGIRGSNDLVWVGGAANYAAKLCSIREGTYKTFLTAAVYSKLNEKGKLGGNPKRDMWTKVAWSEQGSVVYGSGWWWKVL
jgi:class 3 adenylate cyclase